MTAEGGGWSEKARGVQGTEWADYMAPQLVRSVNWGVTNNHVTMGSKILRRHNWPLGLGLGDK